ncbi:MAG: site-2 protease family protein [Thermoplasmata archaeon]|nr:site-2 protease family protein [Thermoplasmata archaeon]
MHPDPTLLEARFDALRRELWEKLYVPQIRYESGEYLVEIVRRPMRTVWRSWSNLILLGLTVLTTVAAGAFLWLAWRGGQTLVASDWLWGGLFFGAPLLAILGLHELAHFLLARHHHVEASLPYFIPVPPPFLLFGTFGAFISLREPIPSKKALLDIGASGPLAGFALTIPITLGGLLLSAHAPALSLSNCGPVIFGVGYGNLEFGPSLFWAGLSLFVPASAFANLHPLALAGWVGLLVTAINLLPAGQLDGGHVFRALLGDRARFVSYGAVALLFLLGIAYQGWIIFGILIVVLGIRHPPPLNDITPLDPKRWAVGGLAAAVLVSGFVLMPIGAPTHAFSLAKGPLVQASSSSMGMDDNLTVYVTNHDFIEHGYTLSATTDAVVATVNGTSVPLTNTTLTRFEANGTWTVVLPDGHSFTSVGTPGVSVPASAFFTVAAGGSATLHLVYTNHERGVVSVSIVVAELCSDGVGPLMIRYQLSY